MVQPVIKARRVYSRYVANQTLEDFSLRYTAENARKRSPLTVSNAALGSISFLALEVIGANIAIFYGFNHLFFALLVALPLIFFNNSLLLLIIFNASASKINGQELLQINLFNIFSFLSFCGLIGIQKIILSVRFACFNT